MNDWKQCSRQSKNTIKMICNIKWNDVATTITEKRKICQQWGFFFIKELTTIFLVRGSDIA